MVLVLGPIRVIRTTLWLLIVVASDGCCIVEEPPAYLECTCPTPCDIAGWRLVWSHLQPLLNGVQDTQPLGGTVEMCSHALNLHLNIVDGRNCKKRKTTPAQLMGSASRPIELFPCLNHVRPSIIVGHENVVIDIYIVTR